MKTKFVLPLLLISATSFIVPAQANWFHNARIGINRNIGSAPNPTPADIREDVMPVVTEDATEDATVATDQQSQTGTVKTAEAGQNAAQTAAAGDNRPANVPQASPSR